MRTDDFFADLERQLGAARPPRRPPTALLIVPLVVVTLAVAALVTGGNDTESEVTAPLPGPRNVEVLVLNGAADARADEGAAISLRYADYRVRIGARVDEGGPSQVDFSGDHLSDAQAIAGLLGIDRVVRVYGAGLPDVVVTLGNDSFGQTVVVLNASGDPQATDRAGEALARAGLRVVGSQTAAAKPKSSISVLSRHLDRGQAVADALRLPDAEITRIRGGDPVAAVAATLGEDFVER